MATDKEIRDLAASRGFRARKFERGTEGDWSLSKTIVFDLTLTDEEVLDLLEKLKNPKERLKYLAAALDVEMNKNTGVS